VGQRPEGEFAETAARAAELWDAQLLAGTKAPLRDALGDTIEDDARTDPVSMLDMGVHLVCPHHLTISFGMAHVAFEPQGKIVGFGGLAHLVERATARLVLQEEATQDIATTLRETLGAKAAVAAIEATHPCHNVPNARSHGARALTVARSGDEDAAKRLETLIIAAIQRED
ncbi:MAG: GTP cyclohydrolase I, partial [Myxococcota bacterium]